MEIKIKSQHCEYTAEYHAQTDRMVSTLGAINTLPPQTLQTLTTTPATILLILQAPPATTLSGANLLTLQWAPPSPLSRRPPRRWPTINGKCSSRCERCRCGVPHTHTHTQSASIQPIQYPDMAKDTCEHLQCPAQSTACSIFPQIIQYSCPSFNDFRPASYLVCTADGCAISAGARNVQLVCRLHGHSGITRDYCAGDEEKPGRTGATATTEFCFRVSI